MGDPRAVWAAVVQRTGDRPALAWLRYLRIERFEGDTAVLGAIPGHREVLAVATPARLEPVAAELSALTGRRVRCVIESAPAGPRVEEGGGPGSRSDSAGGAKGGFDRRAAMQVPLVRQVLEHFPDAMLVDAREEEEGPAEAGAAEAVPGAGAPGLRSDPAMGAEDTDEEAS